MEKRNRHTLTEFRDDPETYVHQVQSTGCPIVLTVDGKDTLVVQDAEDYRRTQAHLEQIEYDAIMDGLDDVKHGRVRPAREALEELFAKYGL